MKVTARGLYFLVGILKTCMLEREDIFSVKQDSFLKNKTEGVPMEEIVSIFPIESETVDKIQQLAEKMKKREIDEEVVLDFFGGEDHMSHINEDFHESGISGKLGEILLLFHTVIPVAVKKENERLIGTYENDDLKFQLRGIECIDQVNINLQDHNQKALVHFGSIFDVIQVGSKEDLILMACQARSDLFVNVGRSIRTVDCESLLRAMSLMKKRHLKLSGK